MSAARISNRVSRLFIILPAASVIAAAGAGAGQAPAALAPARVAGPAHPAAAPAPVRLPLAARLAVSALPVRALSPRYTLTAYTRRRGYQAPRRISGYQAPRRIAWSMLVSFGWPSSQFRFLDRLWRCESNWNPQAANQYSGAYGIPQAVPASKMATAGPDWRWNARTQIRWGLRYIQERYGSPLGAWSHERWYGWY